LVSTRPCGTASPWPFPIMPPASGRPHPPDGADGSVSTGFSRCAARLIPGGAPPRQSR